MQHIKDLGDYYSTLVSDPGDSQYTPNRVFNVCLVPDPKHVVGWQFRDQMIAFSDALCRREVSCYGLDQKPDVASNRFSVVHATFSHVVFEAAPDNIALVGGKTGDGALTTALMGLVGQPVTIKVVGAAVYRGLPFDRLAKATKGKIVREDPSTQDFVAWGELKLTQDIIKKRSAVGAAMSSVSKDILRCIGAQGEDMLPHCTAFVSRHMVKFEAPPFPWGLVPIPQDVPCIVAVGDCGPWGQVRSFVTRPSQVRTFLESHLCR